jgi:hypothetical protein
MANLLSQLTRSEQARLLEEMNYMNLEEIRGFCSARGIPYKVVAEYPNGKVRRRRTPIASQSCWPVSVIT